MHKHVVLVLLDLSAPFDTIDHDILLIDLHRIGVRGDALCWLASYLTDRTQCVSVDGHSSHRTRLRHGVPQGSVLGRGVNPVLKVGGDGGPIYIDIYVCIIYIYIYIYIYNVL